MNKKVKNLYLIGGGGHCKSCIDVVEQTGEFKILGIFDKKENISNIVLGYEIIGSDEDLKKYVTKENFFLITIGQIKSAESRIKIYNLLLSYDAQIATVVSPRAYVSSHSEIGEGSIVMHDVLVNTNVKIGKNCILNSKSLIEHDSNIGDHCHISTAAVVNGNCTIGGETFIGSNAVLKEGILIPNASIVSAGSFSRGK